MNGWACGSATVVEEEADREARRRAYAADVTYVTNKCVAFDYLRDRLHSDSILRGLCFAIVDEADSVLIDDARTPLILSQPGSAPDQEADLECALAGPRTGAGSGLPDRSAPEPRGTDRPRTRKSRGARRRPPRPPIRSRAVVRNGSNGRCRRSTLFDRDRHYIVNEGAIELIDLPTGRRSADRAFEGGVQALIEAKEGLELTPQRETAARISYQRFFGRYLRLAGMTGTAREVAAELWNVYRLRTVTVPTRLPTKRISHGLHSFPDEASKWHGVVERVRELHGQGRPVLIGTASVAASEELSALLSRAGLTHQVLNARQDRDEAEMIARAGEAGRITVATRMAGRGTDIRLSSEVLEKGGLAVVATEVGDARRVDRQLFGRSGRQGTPGSYEQWVSLDDALYQTHLPGWLRRAARHASSLQSVGNLLRGIAQRAEHRQSSLARRRLLEHERGLEKLLLFTRRGSG